MNQDAFISGFLAERRLQKLAVGNYSAPKPPTGPALPPADNPGGAANPSGGSSIPPIGTANNAAPPSQARLAKRDDLLGQQSIARQEAQDLPGQATITGAWLKGDDFYKKQVDQNINQLQPGQSVVPLTAQQQAGHQEVLSRPAVMDFAKQQAVQKSQQIAKATPLNELQQMSTGQMGGNNPLANALKQHVGNDPRNLEALSKIVGNKPGVYGMAGVGPGLKASFTPQNFQFGQFANDHWGKILTGLVALLMGGHMAGKMDKGQQQQRQPEVWD